MLKLRTVLLYDGLYYFLALFCSCITCIRLFIPNTSVYKGTETSIIGQIIKINMDGNKLSLTVKGKEKILVTYYLKTKKEKDQIKKIYQLGDRIELNGTLSQPQKNTTKNLFNYQNYLYHQQIYYLFTATKITLIEKNSNFYYTWKQKLQTHLKEDPYLNTFLLGDKSGLSSEVKASYQENGISHLFAISGMHITLLSSIILMLLKHAKIPETKRYWITSFFLISYLLLTGLSASVLRGVLFFLLFSLNKIYYFYIKTKNILLLTLCITLFVQPHFIFDIGFAYSFSISYALIILGSIINKEKHYLLKLLKTSLISFFVSIPISLFNFYQINGLSIIYNLFYVPFVSILLFPASLIVGICPILLPIYQVLTEILEKSSLLLAKFQPLTWIFPKFPSLFYVLYILFLFPFFYGYMKKKYYPMIPFLFLLTFHYITPFLQKDTYIKMIDVGQGDSLLLHSNQCNVLVDTGGTMTYQMEPWKKPKSHFSIVKNTTIPLLKSMGIHSIDYLVLTHGDADHMGEAKRLVSSFPVKRAILNQGNTNFLEKELIQTKIPIFIGKKDLVFHCGEFVFTQINQSFLDENDSSQVYLVSYKKMKLLLMGDASKKSEEFLLNNYQLEDISLLKIGHHGSRTSSSPSFIETTNPVLSLISAGKDNKFLHPHKEVIKTLEKNQTNYYITSDSGTITLDLKRQSLKEEAKLP